MPCSHKTLATDTLPLVGSVYSSGVVVYINFLGTDAPCFTRTAIDHEFTHSLRCLVVQANEREVQANERQVNRQSSQQDLQNTPTCVSGAVRVCPHTHDERCKGTITNALVELGLWGRMACDEHTRSYDSGFIMEQALHNGIMCMFNPAAQACFVDDRSAPEEDISLALVQHIRRLNDGTMEHTGFLATDANSSPRLLKWIARDDSRRTRSNQCRGHSYSTRN